MRRGISASMPQRRWRWPGCTGAGLILSGFLGQQASKVCEILTGGYNTGLWMGGVAIGVVFRLVTHGCVRPCLELDMGAVMISGREYVSA